jgi:hypothetical protein
MKRKHAVQFALFNLCVAVICAVCTTVYANMITVTNTNDSGPGSLRQALVDANGGDTITFAVTGTIGLTSAELVIDKPITVSGPGADVLAVSRISNAQFRIFHVTQSSLTVNIEGLTISGADAHFDYGGGILNDQATLILTNCSVVDNIAYSGGGGIYSNDGGSVTIVNSIISGNHAAGGKYPYGGGVAGGSLTIINSTISGNSAVGAPLTFGAGGGIAGGGTMTNSTITGNYAGLEGGGISGGGAITNCTISNNGAGGGTNNFPGMGGGIYGGGSISNCTISGNSVFGAVFKGPGLGGGIYAVGTVTISNSTFSDNYVIEYGNGAGICNQATLEIGNTILNRGVFGENVFNNGGTITSAGYNLSNDDGGGYLNGPGDLINTDPLLGPLQDNGGPTQTHALLPGSSAVDAGDPSFAPPPWYDQRGPNFYRLRNDRIDIGSFEVQEGPAVTPTPTPRPAPLPRTRPTPPPRP